MASNKDNKVPIHIARIYHGCKNTSGSKKKKADDITDYEIKSKKNSQLASVCNNQSKIERSWWLLMSAKQRFHNQNK